MPFSLDQMDRQYRAGGVTAAIGLPVHRLHRGVLRRRRHRDQQRAVPAAARGRPRALAAVGVDDLRPPTSTPSATRSRRSCRCRPCPARSCRPARRCGGGAAALGWRHDESPRWMEYPAGPAPWQGRRRSMTETYLPRAERGRRPAAHRPPGRPPRARRWPGRGALELTTPDGRPTRSTSATSFVCGGAIQTPALLQRSGLRRGIGRTLAVHPTVKLAARFDDAVNVPDDVPVHQVKEFAPDLSFGGSASSPGLVALALQRLVGPVPRVGRPTGVSSPCTTRRSPARGAGGSGRPRLARPGRHVPPHPPRPGTCSVRAWPGWPCCCWRPAPRRCTRPTGAPRSCGGASDLADAAGDVRGQPGQRDDGPPLLDGADRDVRRRPGRQLRPARGVRQRPRQRRLAAARRTGRQPAGVGDGASPSATSGTSSSPPGDGGEPERVAAPDTTIVTGAGGWLGRALLAPPARRRRVGPCGPSSTADERADRPPRRRRAGRRRRAPSRWPRRRCSAVRTASST